MFVYILLRSYWVFIWYMSNADLTPRKGRNSKINSPRAGSLFLAPFFSPGYSRDTPNKWACSQATLDTVVDIGRMFETTKDGMQIMAGEDPKWKSTKWQAEMVHLRGAESKRNKANQQGIMTSHQDAQGVDMTVTGHQTNFQPNTSLAKYARK